MAETTTELLHLRSKPGKTDKYIYRTGDIGEIVEVEVYYSLGGTNMFQGTTEPRGVYVSISPMTLERSASGNLMQSFGLFSGIKKCVKSLPKKSDKAVLAVAQDIDTHAPYAAELFAKDKRAAINFLAERVRS